jgi:hypothetical protein
MHVVFKMTPRDFVCELLGLFGAKRQRDGVWPIRGRHVADERSEMAIVATELGWRKWNIKSASVLVSQDGEVFWTTRPGFEAHRIWSVSELVRSIGYCRLKEEAAHAGH